MPINKRTDQNCGIFYTVTININKIELHLSILVHFIYIWLEYIWMEENFQEYIQYVHFVHNIKACMKDFLFLSSMCHKIEIKAQEWFRSHKLYHGGVYRVE